MCFSERLQGISETKKNYILCNVKELEEMKTSLLYISKKAHSLTQACLEKIIENRSLYTKDNIKTLPDEFQEIITQNDNAVDPVL